MRVLRAEDLVDTKLKCVLGMKKSVVGDAGDGLFAVDAVAAHQVVFEEMPKLFVTSRGEYTSKLWNLTAQAQARNAGRTWTATRDTETLKADVRWCNADELQTRALVARYDVTYDRVVVAYSVLKRLGEETIHGAQGFWELTPVVKHACAALAPNVKVYDIGYDGMKRMVALRDIAPLEELVCMKEDFKSVHHRALDAVTAPDWPHQRVGMLNAQDGLNFIAMLSTDAKHEPFVYCTETGYSRVVCFPQLKKLLIRTAHLGHAQDAELKALASEVQARAFAGALENELGVLNCNACGQKTAQPKMCKGCDRAFFCSHACFEAQWKRGHKQLCKLVIS